MTQAQVTQKKQQASESVLVDRQKILQKKRTRCEIWTRVMGYHRPVQNFNTGKKAEFFSRKNFSVSNLKNSKFSQKYD